MILEERSSREVRQYRDTIAVMPNAEQEASETAWHRKLQSEHFHNPRKTPNTS